MKLRSRSSKGEDVIELPSSDDDDSSSDFSDSDYVGVSDEDAVPVILDDSEDSSLPDFNLGPSSKVEFIDDDIVEKVSKRKRVISGGRKKKTGDQIKEEEVDKAESKKPKMKRSHKPTLVWQALEEEIEKWIDENEANEVLLNNQNEVLAETVEQPANLIMPLLRYQKEWLAWSLKQEESASRGGILADEMGMGKTVQAIALVLAKQEIRQAIGEHNIDLSAPSSSTAVTAVKATLVICPVVAVIQWVNEIDRFTSKGSNKVLVYHGSNRDRSVDQFAEYDFVITTYSIIESEFRKYVMPPKDKCQWCGKLLHAKKMASHLRYFCGPDAVRTEKQSKQHRKNSKLKKSTPKLNLELGLDEPYSDGETRRRGRKRGGNISATSAANMAAGSAPVELGEASSSQKSILHSVHWDRIILDEAHYIKDRQCNTTRAIFALKSSYKWALSGTPLQNRVGELYSLVRFLGISPYSFYFCKDCDCRTLDYSSTGDCPECPHKSVRHFCWWNKYVASPIKNYGNYGYGKRAMLLLTQKILKGIVLRRTKKGRAADLALPPRIVTLRRDTLDLKEEDYYTSLYNESRSQFNTYIEQNTIMNNYAHIFDLLTRLRQAVDHPYLVVYSNASIAKREGVAEGNVQECGLCHENAEEAVVTSCSHVFCKSCLIDFSASMGQVSCPTCAKPLTVDFTANKDSVDQMAKSSVKGFRPSSILNRIRLDNFQSSTKIEALREEIRFMVERDGSAKGIVFSQYTSFLDLIHYSLQKSGVDCVQLVGSMTMNARDAAIKRFTDDPDCRIFLMSLKAGGVALNLTVASHVFLMDPWWNPAVERQAQDRIHRIGQYKPIRIVRFVIKDTVEERILKLQEKKELVFEGTIGGSSDALAKLSEADLRFLFNT
ncbi:OLC1v1024980C1 [Oldenlandia corymbosa var. corymbosa]|uniref:OLC1v1024980C1 n=1 Tax=Oldenlandia corymbosa var. corymbosa TaxID=529605 RepID=A0AAV1C6G7_OLDCO|nr:OLC1v1024980C1 [Oldenlandia corymbosa var. corymbosa]